MKYIVSALVAAAWSLAIASLAPLARAEGLDAGIDRAFELLQQDQAAATEFLSQSLAAAAVDGDEDPWLLAEGYFYLGQWQAGAGTYPEAEETFRKGLSILDRIPDAEFSALKIDTMKEMGMAVGRQQRLGNAVDIFERALQMQAKAKGRTDPDRLGTMQLMAITLEAGQSLQAAEFYWRTGLGVALDTGMSADDTAYYRRMLADNLDRQGRGEEARSVRDGADVADIEGELLAAIEAGEKLRGEEKFVEAHALYETARADFAATGRDSVLYMLVLKDLAETGDQERHDRQAAIYEEGIAIQDRLFGLEPSDDNGEFHYLAAREWALHGDFPRAFKGFDDLDGFGNWVGGETAERQRATRSILRAALREPGADEACRMPARTQSSFEILYVGYATDRLFESLGRNQGRAPALDCALALVEGSEVDDTYRYATLGALGLALIDTAQYERSASVFEEALAAAERAGRPENEIRLLLGGMALAKGWTRDFDEALALVDRAEAIGGASDAERLSLMRVRSITLVNAARYPEAEATMRDALALVEMLPTQDAFDNDLASTLNEFADILMRAGRTGDALALVERIELPETLPEDASPAQTIFYLDIGAARMTYLAALERRDEARAAADAFRAAAVPTVDRLLANPERNVILAASIASIMTGGSTALAGVGLNDEAAAIAAKANELIAGDDSPGVRLLAARNELVRAVAALIRGDGAAAMPGFDRALAAGQAILPDDSDEMLEIWLGRGMARLGLARADLADPEDALSDLRRATRIAEARIGREDRFDDQGVQRKMRPSFESLIGSMWLAGNPR